LLKNSQNKDESTIQCISPDSWRTYFQGLLHKENILNIKNIAIDEGELPDEQDSILNSEITADEIITSINKLNRGKSQGTDGIGAEFYKASSHIITHVLCILFNKILATGDFPDIWRNSITVPVHKSGSKLDPSKYKGISLINVMYKIFSNIIYNRLCLWSKEFDKIDEAQAGFRSAYSTVDNMFTLQSLIQKYLSKPGGRFYVLYVDFQKAFDGLVHHNIFTGLYKNGVKGKICPH